MSKIKNKLLVIIITMICLLGIFAGNNNANAAFEVKWGDGENDKKTIKDDYELAVWAKENPKQFVNSNIEDNIGKKMDMHWQGRATIGMVTASCMYHEQGGSGKTSQYTIRNVIYIEGQTATIYYKKNGTIKTKTVTNKYIGAIAYATYKSVNQGEYFSTYTQATWKYAFRYLFFQPSTGLKDKISLEFKGRYNEEPKDMNLVNEAIKAGNKMKTTEPTKESKNSDAKQKDDEYLGPFKFKKGGYEPTKLTATFNGTEKDIKKYYIKKSGEYIEYDDISKLPNNKKFYIKCGSTKLTSWKVRLDFSTKTYITKLVLIDSPVNGDQNLGIFSAISGATGENGDSKYLEWKGNIGGDDDDGGNNDVPSPSGIRIHKVDEDTWEPIAGAEFEVYQLEPYNRTLKIEKTISMTTEVKELRDKDNMPFDTKPQYVYYDDDFKGLKYSDLDPNEDIYFVSKNNSGTKWDGTQMTFLTDKNGNLLTVINENEIKCLINYDDWGISQYGEYPDDGTCFSYLNQMKNSENGALMSYSEISAKADEEIRNSSATTYYQNIRSNITNTFELINGSSVKVITTDSNGEALYNTTKYCKFFVREIKVPNGYGNVELQKSIDDANIKIVQRLESGVKNVYFENRAFAELNIHKVNSTGYAEDADISGAPAMPGVKFRIYYYDDGGNKQYLADEFSEPRKHNPSLMIESSNSIEDKNSYYRTTEEGNTVTYWEGATEHPINILRITTEEDSNSTTEIDKFTTNENSAKVFITDENGNIKINYLPCKRTYYAEEIGFVNEEDEKYFELTDGVFDFDLSNPSSSETETYTISKTIGNTQKYIDLSGDVWLDVADRSKKTKRNNLLKDDEVDVNDTMLKDVTVKLIQKGKEEDKIVKTTKTDDNGHYKFEKIELYYLEDYYVEFTYNGLTYTNVTPYIDKENGSKASENTDSREKFNKDFSIIEKDKALDSDRNKTYDLSYTIDGNIANLNGRNDMDKFTITANTLETEYSVQDTYNNLAKQGEIIREIPNVNLGLYEREQPDIRVSKDIDNVKLTINGYDHIYKYGNRNNNIGDYTDTALEYDFELDDWVEVKKFNVGVMFGEKNDSYSLPVYQADYNLRESEPDSKLQAWITYEIKILNQSTTLQTQVNSIVDYFDTRYDLESIVDKDGNSISDLNFGNIGFNNEYNRIVVDTTALGKIEKGKEINIYMTFKLKDGAVGEILGVKGQKGTGELLDNIVEINSYSTFDRKEGKVYAGICKYSNPGNIETASKDIVDKSQWENDTSWAPSLQLEVAAERSLTGTVFLDNTIGDDLKTGQERIGNGTYDDREKTVENVKVQLVDIDKNEVAQYYDTSTGTWKTAEMYTGSDGQFTFKGYDPGKYQVVYTWGQDVEDENGTKFDTKFKTEDGKEIVINVQDYKGTVYSESRYNININDSEEARLWAEGTSESGENNPDTRYSDAIDDFEIRRKIDSEMTYEDQMSNAEKEKTNKSMISRTLDMTMPIEYGDNNDKDDITWDYEKLLEKITTDSSGDELVNAILNYQVYNVDFGIVERPRQAIKVNKRVSAIKVTLANNETLIDATIDENGNISGQRTHLSYQGPSNGDDGFAKVEMDSELMQNAVLEVVYTISVTNMSEIDYATERYYKFGTDKTKMITVRPSGIIDYLDNGWDFKATNNVDGDGNEIWSEETLDKLKGYTQRSDILVADDVKDIQKSDIANRKIVYTETLLEKALEPLQLQAGKEMKDAMNEGKIIDSRNVTNIDKAVSTVNLKLSRTLSVSDEIALTNEVEVVKIVNGPAERLEEGGIKYDSLPDSNNFTINNYISENIHTGTEIKTIPGNYVPGTGNHEDDSYTAETVEVTPNTGENRNYILPVAIGLVALITLGSGVILIKKFVIDK